METTLQTKSTTENGKPQTPKTKQKITPFLWFDGKAEEAAKFYTSLFGNSKIVNIKYWAEGSPFPKEQVMTATFELDGQQFMLLMQAPCSNSILPFPFLWFAKQRKKQIVFGKNCRTAA